MIKMKKKISIEGMTCKHCVSHVEEALKQITGIKKAKVDLKRKLAVVDMTQPVEDLKLKEAVEEAGYEVTNIE